MPITLTNPIIVDPVPISASALWINTININATTQPVTMYISVSPYDPVNNIILTDKSENIFINDVFGECSTNAKVALAEQSIYDAVGFLCQKFGLFGQSLPPPPPVTSSVSDGVDMSGIAANSSDGADGNL
jgi:hypothetical protein